VKEPLQVTLLGQTFSVRSDASAVDVQRVAAFVNSKLTEVSGGRSADSLHVALLALLNVSGDYLQLCDGAGPGTQELKERLGRLLRQIEQEIPGQPDSSGAGTGPA
jgi:cell division protein ZapA